MSSRGVQEVIDARGDCFHETTWADFMHGRPDLLELVDHLHTIAERESNFHRVCLMSEVLAKHRRWKAIYEFVASLRIEILPGLVVPSKSM
jgi:hypothetical protein